MVVINLKISDKNQFLYETSSSTTIEQLKKELVLGNFHIFNYIPSE